MKRGSLQRFHDIITVVESFHHENHKNLALLKCKIILIDGSSLRILEKYRHNELIYYSYYWLTTNNALIIGWDNAPHHLHIPTHPHHKHLAGRKKPAASNEHNLSEVLAYISSRLK